MIVTLLYLFGVILLILGLLALVGVFAVGSLSGPAMLVLGLLFVVGAWVLSRGTGTP